MPTATKTTPVINRAHFSITLSLSNMTPTIRVLIAMTIANAITGIAVPTPYNVGMAIEDS